ncbi:unnamed protein product [Paramecium pentaurelia]|uniref:Uncharacterized protein n=1 Tax=Paramecium pentaurelia TaxID=43138 RepID=A0A8S1S8S5_9CILI|nr:unnamed protein product [Paramecium pentaurelia]
MKLSSASGCQQREQEKGNKELNKLSNPYKLPIGIKSSKPSDSTQKMEWEKLYEEKYTILRTKNANLEEDLIKCTNIIKEMEQTGNMKRLYQTPTQDNQMILNLKTQVKSLNEQLQDSKQELQNMKRTSKYTKQTELEIECKQFQDETIRLSQITEQLINDNIYQKQFENEQNKLKEILMQREQLIKQMQEELEYYMEENKALSEKLQQMVQAYQELDKVYNKYQNEAKNKLKIKEKQISDLKNDINRISLNTKQSKQITIKKPNPQKIIEKSINNTTKRDQSFKNNNNLINNSNKNNILGQSVNRSMMDLIEQPVEPHELSEIRLELKFQLQNQIGSTIDFNSLYNRLTKQPFLLDEPNAMLLASYLIEKHNQQYPQNIKINLTQQNEFKNQNLLILLDFGLFMIRLNPKFQKLIFQDLKLNDQNFKYLELFILLDQLLKQYQLSLKQMEQQYLLLKVIKDCLNIRKINGSLIYKYLKEIQKGGTPMNYNHPINTYKNNSYLFSTFIEIGSQSKLINCSQFNYQISTEINLVQIKYQKAYQFINQHPQNHYIKSNNVIKQQILITKKNRKENQLQQYYEVFIKQRQRKKFEEDDDLDKYYFEENVIKDDDYKQDHNFNDYSEMYSESQYKYQIKNKTNKSDNYEQEGK